ncbi:MAG: CRISPR-associated protein Cas5 [Candidatus Aenigmatarchaeota archaeon]
MKYLVFRISFFEAFFKVFITRKYQLSYILPLPTSIAGIIGSIIGIERNNIANYFKDMYVGSKYIKGELIFENRTLIELSSNKPPERAVEKTSIINDAEFEIVVIGDDNKIDELKRRIENLEFSFLPFGGQNDFFIKDIKAIEYGEISTITNSNIITGYVKYSDIKSIRNNTRIWIFPVRYKGRDEKFAFIDGEVEVKEPIPSFKNIAVYKFSDFEYKIAFS